MGIRFYSLLLSYFNYIVIIIVVTNNNVFVAVYAKHLRYFITARQQFLL